MLSLRLQRTFLNGFVIAAGIGSRVTMLVLWGFIGRHMVILCPLSIDIHLGQWVVPHHRCRDRSLIVIVSQDQVRAQASLQVVDRIVSYR